ncbi:Serine/threonine-protein kinase MRCK alpha [Gossypium arboreum]|uniref:Serine/threonine-protein kinase MRCK alpha n=1 Tax=Gossypium arboreum TaxID=29729 RepID=A0A0B0PBL1_GOSAR|nr:Serine/threonine-protein kinase MRCK alpha [Gossypium arboreum]KHG21719.1 Serine/threonine-protein kinase MRCK alpha [Gossypium arboreum]
MYFNFLRDVNRPQKLLKNLVDISSRVDVVDVLQPRIIPNVYHNTIADSPQKSISNQITSVANNEKMVIEKPMSTRDHYLHINLMEKLKKIPLIT